MREQHLMKCFDFVNRLEPDFVVITGDFITASARHYARRIGGLLKRLAPKVDTLAVLGNHDYGVFVPNQKVVRGLGEYVSEQLDSAGVKVLTNKTATYRQAGAVLHFAGIGEVWSPDHDPSAAFASIDARQPVIALVHNPDAAPHLSQLGARYILAGHTHGRPSRNTRMHNALWPAVFLNFGAGEYDLGDDRKLYVNRGIGPSRRVCANTRPEVTMFTLRRAVAQVRPSRPSWAPAEINSTVAASTLQGMFCPLPQDETSVATA
jgi:predicted MPP superfamily phosphohydrolase